MKRLLVVPLVSLLTFSCFETSLMAAQVWAWGNNSSGQLNIPGTATNAVAISAGWNHGMALLGDGRVVAWGDNSTGQANVPEGLANAVEISAGLYYSLALKADGTVVGWGLNNSGQISIPANLSDVVAVSAGGGHVLALKADRSVVAWGDNNMGQTNVPMELTNAVAVSAGGNVSFALCADGTVRGWGKFNTTPPQAQIVIPPDWTNVVAVSASESHALALLASGIVKGIGDNFYGELNVPQDLTNAAAISTGAFGVSLALKADGTVVTWGANTNPPPGLVATAISAGPNAGGEAWDLALANTPQGKVIINFVSPQSQTIAVGSQAFFSVGASGASPLNYQWYFGTNLLQGATNQYLALNNVQASQTGAYTVMVSNSLNAVISQPVMLNVIGAANIFLVPSISLEGGIGNVLRIDYINAVGPTNNWTTLATVTLTNTQEFYSDYSAIGQPSRIYRIVQLP